MEVIKKVARYVEYVSKIGAAIASSINHLANNWPSADLLSGNSDSKQQEGGGSN